MHVLQVPVHCIWPSSLLKEVQFKFVNKYVIAVYIKYKLELIAYYVT